MLFRGTNKRRHRRHSYLQFVTFFSLGPEVAWGSRCAVGVDLSHAGVCMFTPYRLRKGQVIVFNNPLPVPGLKAVVRWVKKYRSTAPFYKAGVSLSVGPAEDVMGISGLKEEGGADSMTRECVEGRSSATGENGNLFAPGGLNNDFWSELANLPEKEAEQFISLSSELMLHGEMKDSASVRLMRANALLRKATLILGRQGRNADDGFFNFAEEALRDFRSWDELTGGDHGQLLPAILEEALDRAATALDRKMPGRTQEILGRTNLACLGERLYFRDRQYAPSDEEMAVFGKIYFRYPRIVRSAEIFYKALGEPGKRYINAVLFEETSPRSAAGDPNDPLCIIGLVEDGTFHIVKDFSADRSNRAAVGVAKQPAAGGSLYRRRRGKRNAVIVAAGSAAVLLVSTVFLLTYAPPKPVSGPEKDVAAKPATHQTQEDADRLDSLPEMSVGVTSPGQELNGPPAKKPAKKPAASKRVRGGKEKPAQGTPAKKAGQTLTVPESSGRARLPDINKRSFAPHSRDDL